jgi:antitoxin component of MazEF toxin-antitoxin module
MPTTKLARWGNSSAVRLPKSVTEVWRVPDGAEIEVSVEGSVVTLRPAKASRSRALYEQMLRDFREKGPPETILREGLRGRERDILDD